MSNENIILDYAFPENQAGTYTPAIGDAQVKQSGVTLNSNSLSLDAEGRVTNTAAWQQIAQLRNLPARPSGATRLVEVIFQHDKNVLPPDGLLLVVETNWQDGNNRWASFVQKFGNYSVEIQEATLGVFNTRDNATIGALDEPRLMSMRVYERDDYIWACVQSMGGNMAAANHGSIEFFQSNRNHKANTPINIYFSDVIDLVKVSRISVRDIHGYP